MAASLIKAEAALFTQNKIRISEKQERITTMKEQQHFRTRAYGRTELAQLYSPSLAPSAAWRRLAEWIDRYPGLAERLAATGYQPGSRSWTPAQVAMIVEAIGEP